MLKVKKQLDWRKPMSNKKALVIIHGLAGNPSEHIGIMNYFSEKYDVYTYYLPGHEKGFLNHPKKEDWIKASEEIIEVLRKKHEEIYIVGHSMGGVIASYLASKYPEIKKLVLEAPAFSYNPNPGLKWFKYYDKKFFLTITKRFFVSVIKEFKELVNEYKDTIKKVKIPVLIIQGQDDIMVPYQSSINVYNKIKDKDKYLVLIKDLTHSLFYDDKYEEMLKMIEDFLIHDSFDSEFYNEKLNKELVR